MGRSLKPLEVIELFASSPEEEGVTALQPHHLLSGLDALFEPAIELVLAGFAASGEVSGHADLSVEAIQELGGDQAIGNDQVSGGERVDRPGREKRWISRTRANQGQAPLSRLDTELGGLNPGQARLAIGPLYAIRQALYSRSQACAPTAQALDRVGHGVRKGQPELALQAGGCTG